MLQAGVFAVFLAAAALYAFPSILAIMKGRRLSGVVVAINILLGWTIVGWLVALTLALGSGLRRPAWTKWTRKPRTRAAAPVGERERHMPPTPMLDPPEIREDVYAAWLDEGEALPTSEGDGATPR